jgi:hypothetical protein
VDLRHRPPAHPRPAPPHRARGRRRQCTRDKQGFRLINLPSGEAFIVPYEGERKGDPEPQSAGIHPGPLERTRRRCCTWRAESHRPTSKAAAYADRLRAHFDVDPARRNVAELGLGCNDRAVVMGSVLEDEKAGFHWAYGRSEHLGGVTVVGPDAFRDPAHVVHHDIVYARRLPDRGEALRVGDPAVYGRRTAESASCADNR